MKTIRILIATISLMSLSQVSYAQDDYDFYLQRVLQRIDEGDCEGAQKNYNVYKELSGKTMASVEEMIKDCASQYRLGETINVKGENYIIAYLTENNQHGFAIKDVGGVQDLENQQAFEYLRDKKIPSFDEMKLIYQNNAIIGLTGTYWTRTTSHPNGIIHYYWFDFLSGKYDHSNPKYNRNGILLIHRF